MEEKEKETTIGELERANYAIRIKRRIEKMIG